MKDSTSKSAFLAGKFEMPLADGELRQRGVADPMVFKGPALITQDEAGALILRFFSIENSELALMRHMQAQFSTQPGVLVPEDHYYDFTGVGTHGETWAATGLDGEWSFGASTYLKLRVRNIESVHEPAVRSVKPNSFVHASMVGEFDLPWHVVTKSDTGTVVDVFEHRAGRYHWRLRKADDGMDLEFGIVDADPEPAFRRLLIALGIVAGKSVVPVLSNKTARDGVRVSKMHSPARPRWKAKLLRPTPHLRPDVDAVHAFIQAFLEAPGRGEPGVDHSELIYGLWHRVLRAGEHDVANSALVLSVVIEALLEQSFASDWEFDAEFASEIEHAQALVDSAGFKERARKRLTASLKHALQPGPKTILHRLKEQGFIDSVHIKAWERLRNKSAHGHDLGDLGKLQTNLDLYHQCLGLFYRLVFVLIGYRGKYVDYSAQHWPTAVFDRPAEEPLAMTSV